MFHVPERYRLIGNHRLASDISYGNNGAFRGIPSKCSKQRIMNVIASDGMGWEHISVHIEDKKTGKLYTPLWDEMCQIKDMFWDGDDIVMQLHPRASEYVNNHPNVLHLWRPTNQMIPTPPSILVGIKV